MPLPIVSTPKSGGGCAGGCGGCASKKAPAAAPVGGGKLAGLRLAEEMTAAEREAWEWAGREADLLPDLVADEVFPVE